MPGSARLQRLPCLDVRTHTKGGFPHNLEFLDMELRRQFLRRQDLQQGQALKCIDAIQAEGGGGGELMIPLVPVSNRTPPHTSLKCFG